MSCVGCCQKIPIEGLCSLLRCYDNDFSLHGITDPTRSICRRCRRVVIVSGSSDRFLMVLTSLSFSVTDDGLPYAGGDTFFLPLRHIHA